MDDVTVVVGTCDAYRNVWPVTCYGLDKYWQDCPWQIMFLSNYLMPPCGFSLRVGHLGGWTPETRAALQFIDSPVVLYMMEDAWLTAPVQTRAVTSFAEIIIRGNADCIRLCHTNRPGVAKCDFGPDKRLYVFADDAAYRVSLQAALWSREAFLALLHDGESPWDFEVQASIRSRGTDRYLCAKEFAHLRYVHPSDPEWTNEPVLRGQWTDAARKYILREGLDPIVLDKPAREP